MIYGMYALTAGKPKPGIRLRIVGKRRKNRIGEKKIGEWSEPRRSLEMGKGGSALTPFPPPLDTARVAWLANIFPIWPRFLPFPPTAEPSPRLGKLV